MDTFMENSAPSNVWTYYARWHRYFASLIETNVFEISCLLCMSFCFVILYVTIWCKDNKLIIYLSIYLSGPIPLLLIGIMLIMQFIRDYRSDLPLVSHVYKNIQLYALLFVIIFKTSLQLHIIKTLLIISLAIDTIVVLNDTYERCNIKNENIVNLLRNCASPIFSSFASVILVCLISYSCISERHNEQRLRRSLDEVNDPVLKT